MVKTTGLQQGRQKNNFSGIQDVAEVVVWKHEKVNDQQQKYVWDLGGHQQQLLMVKIPWNFFYLGSRSIKASKSSSFFGDKAPEFQHGK